MKTKIRSRGLLEMRCYVRASVMTKGHLALVNDQILGSQTKFSALNITHVAIIT